MKILVKFPTRNRPHLFIKNLKEYKEKTFDHNQVQWLISYDSDDKSMSTEVLKEARSIIPDIMLVSGTSNSKIHAVNRDIEIVPNWDIILIVSDDMWVRENNWDRAIRENMEKHFPDTDGCLWFHDGTIQKRISTLSCIGRKYYKRREYVYFPEYKSFFCDNEYTEVAMIEDKMVFIDQVIIGHEHPDWKGKIPMKDQLYKNNDKHWKHDEDLYNSRKILNFPA